MLVIIHVQVCGSKDLAAMLAGKRSAGVTPNMNLRNPFHTGEEEHKQGSTLALKPREYVTRSPKQDICDPMKKSDTDVLQN